MFIDLISPVLNTINTVISRLVPDKAEAARMQQEITLELMQQEGALKQSAAAIIEAEAKSENFLTSAWRPITMLTFVTLITARWLGFTAPGLSEAEVIKLWGIMEIGLGGYVIGRSVEKIAPSIAQAVARR